MGLMLSQQGFQGFDEIPEWYLRYLHRLVATWSPPKSPTRSSSRRDGPPLSRSCPPSGSLSLTESTDFTRLNLAASLEWPPKLSQSTSLDCLTNPVFDGHIGSRTAVSQGGLSSLYSNGSTMELHGRTGRFVRVPSVLLTPPPDLIPQPMFEPRFLTTPFLVGVMTPRGSTRPTRSSFATQFMDQLQSKALSQPVSNIAKDKVLRRLPSSLHPQFLSGINVIGKPASFKGKLPSLNAQMALDCRILDEVVAAGCAERGVALQDQDALKIS
ncbi:hypothetical protein CEUSTIGMA_g3434.t1 [Chlamydomonas eustigma]|uniref:Uncharacterized protein n=1 Tax=Chlamydomonas eustigma TaxID=1157962 RepID=A0A250WYT1_9CHLO|nr:hypothetical protein CEUSTIGMA_g3434.t1 [Chlamydomonas eustigma]|eukprot:GAX75991.1 hypothetical protein CEUSTIGMA_g3434.t1 [Chlamydomonas eustigma]